MPPESLPNPVPPLVVKVREDKAKEMQDLFRKHEVGIAAGNALDGMVKFLGVEGGVDLAKYPKFLFDGESIIFFPKENL